MAVHNSKLFKIQTTCRFGLTLGLAALAGGCSSGGLTSPGLDPPSTSAVSSSKYVPTAEERALNCGKLAGRSQVLILQIRGQLASKSTSQASRAIHSAAAMTGANGRRGVDPAGELGHDIARVRGYNRMLRAKRCGSFDLKAEFSPSPPSHTPRLMPYEAQKNAPGSASAKRPG